MKRIIISLIFFAVFLAGCNKSDKYNIPEETHSSEKPSINKTFSNYVYDNDRAQLQSFNRLAISQKGYYYTANHTLFYYDVEKDINMPMCSDANCNHYNKNCAAYVRSYGDSGNYDEMDKACNCYGKQVYYYNNKIYMIERTKDSEFCLDQYDTNFNNMKRIAVLASDDMEYKIMSMPIASEIDDGYFYYLAYKASEDYIEKKTLIYAWMRIALEENAKPEVLGSYEMVTSGFYGECCDKVLVNENYIYLLQGFTASNYEYDNMINFKVCRYSKINGQFEELSSYKGNDKTEAFGFKTQVVNEINNNVCMDNNNNLYVLNESGTCIEKLNFENKYSEVIYSANGNINEMAFDGEYIYIIEMGNIKGNAMSDTYLIVLDSSGKIKVKYSIEYSEGYLKHYEYVKENLNKEIKMVKGNVYINGVDDRYIMIHSTINAYKGLCLSKNNIDTAENMDSETIIAGVGLIDKEELLKGNVVEIKQIYQYK